MLWSILICGIPERYHSVQPLLYSLLEAQAISRRPDVELLYFMDNKRRTVGAKRNALLSMAIGEYISFIDDDDEVAPNYVDKIIGTIIKERKRPPQYLDCPQCGGHAGLIDGCKTCLGSGQSKELSPFSGPRPSGKYPR